MTLLEVLVAVLIATSGIALLVPAFVRQLQVSNEPDRLTKVEAMVSSDLDWIRDYARWWKMQQGPYNLSSSITKTADDFVYSPELVYAPPASACESGTLATPFLEDASTVVTTPPRPFSVPAGGGSADLSTVDSELKVQRTISPMGSRVHLRYSLSGVRADSLRFSRQASVLIEAAAWCEKTLP